MSKMKVALIGRPNVGKSTLFNRLCGKKLAIVEDTPGVTRDWKQGNGNIGPMEFVVFDTAGLDDSEKNSLAARMTKMSEYAIDQADVCLFMVDAASGVLAEDEHFTRWLHRKNKPVILVINKAENKKARENIPDFYRLGFNEMVVISGAHGEGMIDLYEALDPYHQKAEQREEQVEKEEVIKIAIVGRPNAGKSTYINSLTNSDRLLTGPEPGITRDSISIDWEYKGNKIKLYDTAGVRKKAVISLDLEKMAVSDSMRAIDFAHAVVLLMDVENALESQDIEIAEKVIREGRCLVLAFNKCDDKKAQEKVKRAMRDKLNYNARFLEFAPMAFLSAQNRISIFSPIEEALKVYKEWNQELNKRTLNEWLEFVTQEHPLPLAKSGRRVKIKYIRQINTRPPIFLLFTNHPEDIKEDYQRYMVKSLRECFNLPHTPIRFMFRKTDNPYASDK
ncbi:MAG: ribosome biogenesis GTPase Der [Alphaproteobacteria bacterium 33-17]|nr:MAG: ribosome biogenesis GTPase Der [Alphaproteobacteria bacterium 33-17]